MARRDVRGQLDLFSGEELPAPVAPLRKSPDVEPATQAGDLLALGRALPPNLWLGTSSWSFPGWTGHVYARDYPESRLARQGLGAYAKHPLFKAVGLDRGYYAPLEQGALEAYAGVVPDDFRFLVKAPELLTVARFPKHPRYPLGGEPNPQFLDREMARQWLSPIVEGLGEKLGCILLQFPQQSPSEMGGALGFAARLHDFLEALPQAPYAVELRNPPIFSSSYLGALQRLGVTHCLNVHPSMPSLLSQAQRVGEAPGLRVVRWMLSAGGSRGDAQRPPGPMTYEKAVEAYEPFDRLVDEDAETRATLAKLIKAWLHFGHKVMVIVNNKAEGCAPLTLRKLCESL